MIPDLFARLAGLKIARSEHIFGTRYFYFVTSDSQDLLVEEVARLTVECPWRFTREGTIIVGSEDYGLQASTNTSDDWDRAADQWGHLQNELLEREFGHIAASKLVFSKQALIVQQAGIHECGGFQIDFTEQYRLSGFPTSANELEWLLSFEDAVYSFMNGKVSVQTNDDGPSHSR